MEKLVQGLGYLDYRDFMVCNKYVFETEKWTDAYQRAWADFLRRGMEILEERR